MDEGDLFQSPVVVLHAWVSLFEVASGTVDRAALPSSRRYKCMLPFRWRCSTLIPFLIRDVLGTQELSDFVMPVSSDPR
jgi:hypothetical protein